MQQLFSLAVGMTVGAQPQALHSHASASKDEKLYLFGGYDGSTYGTMSKAVFPSDLCVLQSTFAGCMETVGCSACIEGNSTLVACMSNSNISPDRYVGYSCVNTKYFVLPIVVYKALGQWST